MIAQRNKPRLISETELNQIEVTVGGRSFWLHTDDEPENVLSQVQDFLGGACKPQAELVVHTKKRLGRPRKNVVA